MHVPLTEVILSHAGAELARATLPPGEYVIGREASADLHANTPLLSRQHARLTINYDHVLLEDLGSSNGTFVNERPVSAPTRLFPNQSVRLGPDITLEVHRQRTPSEPGVSLAPAQATLARHLPAELLAEKRYTIGSVVAQGGMGAILDARQSAMKRTVAMKVMLATGDEADVLRFIEEAQITGQLDHPNIVPIHELGVDEHGQPFYTMKMVRGITLKKVLELLAAGVPATVKKYPLQVLLTIFQKVCDALAFAHSKGVIHRDLKPENVMLGDFGSVLVMDWGLAKVIGQKDAPGDDFTRSIVMSARAAEPEASGTMAGAIMGTPAYMSPEQARGEVESLDARSDIYALGAILFELLHLRPAYTGRTAMEIVEKVQRGAVEWAAHRARALPDSLAAMVRQAMAFEKAERYRSVEDLQADLLAYQNGFATSAEKAGAWRQIALLVRRHKATALGLTAVFLVGVTLGTKALIEARRAEREARRATAALADLRQTAPALLQLAASEAALQRFDSALEKADAALALDPALTAARWRRGWVLFAQEKLPEAVSALREAAGREPANRRSAELIPLVEKMAAAPAEKRYAFEIIRPIYDHLSAAGATGEATPLLPHLKLSNEARLAVVKDRLERWLGKPAPEGPVPYQVRWMDGVSANLDNIQLSSLEPLRGLPLDHLSIQNCGLTNLEPLRGLPLRRLILTNNPLADLRPLEGMPLKTLIIYTAPDLKDISPLAGMPLDDLTLGSCSLSDYSALRGMPLRRLILNRNSFTDGSILRGMPLVELSLGDNKAFSDVSSFVGLPLRMLNVSGCKVTDFTPLLRIPILESLETTASIQALLPLRAHPGLKRIKISTHPYRPIAEFWAEYDAQQAAGKK